MSVKEIIICGNCLQPFQMPRSRPSARKFCSQSCYFAKKKLTSFRPCKRCGNPVAKKSNLVFCSNACFGKARPKPNQVFTCQTCGQEYIRKGYTKKSQWCSRSCKHTFIERKCLLCDNIFRVQQWEKDRRRFCSQRCAFCFQGETSIEKMVRESLELMNLAFIPQYKIGIYFADFYLPSFNTAIEADGTHWHSGNERKERDRKRDAFFLTKGICTIRLPEAIIRSTENLAELIAEKLHQLQK